MNATHTAAESPQLFFMMGLILPETPEERMPGRPHGPLAEDVIAFFEAVRGAPARGRP